MKALMIAMAAVSLAAVAPGGEKEQADALEKLRDQVRAVLPAGWVVKITPNLGDGRWHDTPVLEIQTSQAVTVVSTLPCGPANEEPRPQQQKVTLRFSAMPYLSPEAYTKAVARNEERLAERKAFVKKLNGIRWGHKGPEPIPPHAFEPRDAKEERLVREYQLLWMRTEPEKLPTHHLGDLAFVMGSDKFFMHIVEEGKAKEYEQIHTAVGKILKTY